MISTRPARDLQDAFVSREDKIDTDVEQTAEAFSGILVAAARAQGTGEHGSDRRGNFQAG